ncbi:MAG: hypothetical protein QXS54_00785 [Candidatus Methanomethylicaceae archaeon]
MQKKQMILFALIMLSLLALAALALLIDRQFSRPIRIAPFPSW